MKKRNILMIVLVLALVGFSITVAYLTSESNTVVNTFVSGKVDIDLIETSNIDPKQSTYKNTYKMYPGAVIDKDPKVIVKKDSEECYLYVGIQNGLVTQKNGEATTNIDTNLWKKIAKDSYIYRYHEPIKSSDKDQTIVVFTKLTIPTEFNNEDMKNLNGNAIYVNAFAVQKNGLKNGLTTADDLAKNAFPTN